MSYESDSLERSREQWDLFRMLLEYAYDLMPPFQQPAFETFLEEFEIDGPVPVPGTQAALKFAKKWIAEIRDRGMVSRAHDAEYDDKIAEMQAYLQSQRGRPLEASSKRRKKPVEEAEQEITDDNRERLNQEADDWFSYPIDALPPWIALVMADAGLEDDELKAYLSDEPSRVREETSGQILNASRGQIAEYWRAFLKSED